MIYGTLNQKPKDEMQKSQRPHIKAKHQWYEKENNDTKFMISSMFKLSSLGLDSCGTIRSFMASLSTGNAMIVA